MKDDLISRKAAVSRISDLLMLELKGQRIPTWNEVYNAIGDIPSVPAVPLDKLCELCEEEDARVPCVLCRKIMPEWCKQHNNLPLRWDEEWNCPTWKQSLTKWMEEQNEQKETIP